MIGAAVWAAEPDAGGHVFDGNAGYLGARNRGRIPFVEFWISGHDFKQLSYTGGAESSSVKVRVHVGGRDLEIAQELAYEIGKAAVTAIRSVFGTTLGDESDSDFGASPWGHALDIELAVLQSYAKATP